MSNELTPPNQPGEPTGTDLSETGSTPVDPTADPAAVESSAVEPSSTGSTSTTSTTTEIGSTMDLPFIEALPTASAPAPGYGAAPADSYAAAPVTTPVPETPAYATTTYEVPERLEAPILRGPSPWTVVHGLIALAVAVVIFVTTATTADIDWGTAGPATVVGFGVVLVLLGLLGMRSRRRLGA